MIVLYFVDFKNAKKMVNNNNNEKVHKKWYNILRRFSIKYLSIKYEK